MSALCGGARTRPRLFILVPLAAIIAAAWPFAWAAAQAPKSQGQASPTAREGHRHGDASAPPIAGEQPGAHAHGGKDEDHPTEGHGEGAHMHAPVPAEYRTAHIPAAAWTNEPLLARGKEIYATRCAVCHGEQGDGKGPAAMGLPVKPPSFRDPKMVGEMAGNYWFWRVSEGGSVEPFKSMGSVMPAWKTELTLEDRWAVIAYTHTLSGHTGPHVTSEHPQMVSAGHAQHGAAEGASKPAGAPTQQPASAPAHKH